MGRYSGSKYNYVQMLIRPPVVLLSCAHKVLIYCNLTIFTACSTPRSRAPAPHLLSPFFGQRSRLLVENHKPIIWLCITSSLWSISRFISSASVVSWFNSSCISSHFWHRHHSQHLLSPSLFHSRLKTFLFNKSFHRNRLLLPLDCLHHPDIIRLYRTCRAHYFLSIFR